MISNSEQFILETELEYLSQQRKEMQERIDRMNERAERRIPKRTLNEEVEDMMQREREDNPFEHELFQREEGL